MAIHMAFAISLISQVRRILIFTDLRSIHKPRKSSEQTIIQDILEVIQSFECAVLIPSFIGVPAHLGITGNEKADIAAKKIDVKRDYSAAELSYNKNKKLRSSFINRLVNSFSA